MRNFYISIVIITFILCSSVYLIGTLVTWIAQRYMPKLTDILDVITSLILMFLMSFFIFPLPIFMVYYIYKGLKDGESEL